MPPVDVSAPGLSNPEYVIYRSDVNTRAEATSVPVPLFSRVPAMSSPGSGVGAEDHSVWMATPVPSIDVATNSPETSATVAEDHTASPPPSGQPSDDGELISTHAVVRATSTRAVRLFFWKTVRKPLLYSYVRADSFKVCARP